MWNVQTTKVGMPVFITPCFTELCSFNKTYFYSKYSQLQLLMLTQNVLGKGQVQKTEGECRGELRLHSMLPGINSYSYCKTCVYW